MQQPHTEPRFEPAHRFAEPRGADAGEAGAIAKAFGTRHGHKRGQIRKIDFHRVLACTACVMTTDVLRAALQAVRFRALPRSLQEFCRARQRPVARDAAPAFDEADTRTSW